MVHLPAAVGAERRGCSDGTVQHIFNSGAVSAVQILRDDHQFVSLPDQPADLFQEEPSAAMVTNPVTKYPSAESLNEMLGIQMPELPEDFGAKTGYYAVVADVVAEIEYEFPEEGKLLLRLSKETGNDISGVYGAEFYEDREIAGTMVEIDKYQSMLIARGIVKTMDEQAYAFAVDAEGLTQEQFDKAVVFFVESCSNQRTGK